VITTRVYVTHPDLALAETIEAHPEAEIEVVSDVGTDPRRDAYFFRIDAPDFDAVESSLATDHTVADVALVRETGSRRTYRIQYSDDATLITPAIAERGGLTLETTSYRNGWLLRLQLDGHDTLYDIDEYATRKGISFEVIELKQTAGLGDRSDSGLTAAQIEALVTAHGLGYYADPRDASLEDVADALGISDTAASGRLRRGSARLVEEMLVTEE